MFGRCRYGICGRPGYEKEWRADPKQAAGGQFIEQGTHALDLFRWFLGEAEEAVKQAGLADRITLRCERYEAVAGARVADAVISNSLLHHLPNPLQFWQKIRQLVRPGAPVLVMDLLRPDSPEAAQAIVDQ